MRRSGFDAVCKRMVQDEGCVYVGLSAGGIVAGRHIGTAFWKGWDDPSIVGLDWTLPSNLEGLGLLPNHVVFPHHDEEKHAELVQQRSAELKDGETLLLLGDDEIHCCALPYD
mmetsp:Transcript_13480/g.25724  ORF Transcript_13480/g.25724 Transcript_13480/m.25724 type:complete len:113 (-) Transcript_13480:203-541(-)